MLTEVQRYITFFGELVTGVTVLFVVWVRGGVVLGGALPGGLAGVS